MTVPHCPVQRRSGPPKSPDPDPEDIYMFGAFCVQDVKETPLHNSEASLIFKDMEVMAFLNRDTMAKAFNRIEIIVTMAARLSNKLKMYIFRKCRIS